MDQGLRTPSSNTRYLVRRLHARGGLGKVSVAFDVELNREVAFKEMLDDVADRLDMQRRFVREAEVTSGLEHPGVVPIYGLGVWPDGRPWSAMRLIAGEDLKAALANFHEQRSQRSWAERWRVFRSLLARFVNVCNTLAYAHSRGVVHRDLKPANIMLGWFGETLVLDWGLAALTGDQQEVENRLRPALSGSADLTQVGVVLGTPAYMSPEQAAGETATPASDIYALGAIL
jgi:serine/threonine protein kinase